MPIEKQDLDDFLKLATDRSEVYKDSISSYADEGMQVTTLVDELLSESDLGGRKRVDSIISDIKNSHPDYFDYIERDGEGYKVTEKGGAVVDAAVHKVVAEMIKQYILSEPAREEAEKATKERVEYLKRVERETREKYPDGIHIRPKGLEDSKKEFIADGKEGLVIADTKAINIPKKINRFKHVKKVQPKPQGVGTATAKNTDTIYNQIMGLGGAR
jgi:hypothetical protein